MVEGSNTLVQPFRYAPFGEHPLFTNIAMLATYLRLMWSAVLSYSFSAALLIVIGIALCTHSMSLGIAAFSFYFASKAPKDRVRDRMIFTAVREFWSPD